MIMIRSDCDILQNARERYAHENAICSSELNSDFDEDEGWPGVGEGMQRMQWSKYCLPAI